MVTVALHPHRKAGGAAALVPARSLSLLWNLHCGNCSSPAARATTLASTATASSKVHRSDLPPLPRTFQANSMCVLRRHSMSVCELPATCTPEAVCTRKGLAGASCIREASSTSNGQASCWQS